MVKYIVMDLGETIIHNVNMDFEQGLKFLHDEVLLPSHYQDVLSLHNKIFNEAFKKRDNDDFEINMHNYLRCFEVSFGFLKPYDYFQLEQAFLNKITHITLVKDVLKLLEYAKEYSIVVYVLSNSAFTSCALRAELEMLGISKYINKVFSSADYILRKPNELFMKLIPTYIMRIDPSFNIDETIYIGNDFKYDVIGASKIFKKVVWFNEVHNAPLSKQNYLEIDSYLELIKLLKEGKL